jgi:hypothetical protein
MAGRWGGDRAVTGRTTRERAVNALLPFCYPTRQRWRVPVGMPGQAEERKS